MLSDENSIGATRIQAIDPDLYKGENRTTTLASLMACIYLLTATNKEDFTALYRLACHDRCGAFTWELMKLYPDRVFEKTKKQLKAEQRAEQKKIKAQLIKEKEEIRKKYKKSYYKKVDVKKSNVNKKWYNNGKINRLCYTCPEGFVQGILRDPQKLTRDAKGRFIKVEAN